MKNGGIIGPLNTTTTTRATGVWSSNEVYDARVKNVWPIGPVLYNYAKYTIDSGTTYINPSQFTYLGTFAGHTSGYDNWDLNSSTGYYTHGTYITADEVLVYEVQTASTIRGFYNLTNNTKQIYTASCDAYPWEDQGTYISTVIAADGTYPDDGSQSGYWWVKGARYT